MVSNIVYFHPYLGNNPILTHIVQRGGNHQLVFFGWPYWDDQEKGMLLLRMLPFEDVR